MVVAEASGDTLGAGLIAALKKYYPDLLIEGIAGPKMQALGARTLFPMESLSVMGIFEVLKHIPRILWIRFKLYRHFSKIKPDLFVGIDAPDFNLRLEKKLRKKGIKTVHYTSPSVWAWRAWRIHTIAKSVDLMLTLLPFENAIYEKHDIPVKFVGHPLADQIPAETDKIKARELLHLPPEGRVMAILPGSRERELHYLSELFIKTAKCSLQHYPDLRFVVPMVNEARYQQFYEFWQKTAPEIPFILLEGKADLAMTAADVVLVASGTATLEAMLLKRPMIVAYRTAALSAYIVKCLIKVDWVSLPNLIAGKKIVPEYIHYTATVDNLVEALRNYLDNPHLIEETKHTFSMLNQRLRCNASESAAKAILEVISPQMSRNIYRD
jgi:lipid-A-disaccharide synthase